VETKAFFGLGMIINLNQIHHQKTLRFGIALFLVLLLNSCDTKIAQSPGQTPLTDRFDPQEQSYAFVIPNLSIPEGLVGIKASDCGVCHRAIYEEWKGSTHANALRDIQFQAELTKPDSPKWICLNCHIPVQNQREKIITALIENDIFRPVTSHNPQFDRAMQQEGVTCASCHVRVDQSTGKSFIIGPNGSNAAPHPVRKDKEHLRNICNRCHYPMGEGLTPNLICWFYTEAENKAAQPLLKKNFGKPMDCVDCHMPEQQRLVAEDFKQLPERAVNQHLWIGGGVPKWFENYDSLLTRGYRPGLDVTVGELQPANSGKEFRLPILLKNSRAGHDLPTGDPERFIKAIVRIFDGNGHVLQEETLRIGQTWAWNPARKLSDNRLKYGEERLWEVSFPLEISQKASRLEIVVYHVKLKTETAAHIRNAENIDEKLFENGAEFTRNLIDYYPMASYIFKEDIDLKTGKRRRYSLPELIHLSQSERGKPLKSRDY
jgi:hypothetical protein